MIFEIWNVWYSILWHSMFIIVFFFSLPNHGNGNHRTPIDLVVPYRGHINHGIISPQQAYNLYCDTVIFCTCTTHIYDDNV